MSVSEHLALTAPLMDRVTAVRTVHHDVIDEHAAASNRMHPGRIVSGTAVYPSLGSIVAHERSAVAEGVPPYVVIGYPNVSRGPGFLGARAGYLYLTDTGQGPPASLAPTASRPGASRAAKRFSPISVAAQPVRPRPPPLTRVLPTTMPPSTNA